MTQRRINILWVDDDLEPFSKGATAERTRLQPWLRWFKKRQEQFRLIEVNDLGGLASALRKAEHASADSPDFLDALLVDIMWRQGTGLSGTFDELGFPDESILPLDGGAQFLGLMLNASFAKQRPPWLACPPKRKIAVLTTLVAASSSVDTYLDQEALKRVDVSEKEIKGDPHTGLLVPGDRFVCWCNGLREGR